MRASDSSEARVEHETDTSPFCLFLPRCSDASALQGGTAALPLIVHDTESGGVPKLHTTATAAAEPSMGERIKEGIGGMFHKKEEPSEVGEAGGVRAEAAPSHGETSVSGAHAHAQKPSVIESVTEKMREVLHIGQ